MSNIAIKVENLGKKYIIKHEQKESYQTFQDMLLRAGKQLITSPFFKRGTEGVGSLNPFNKDIKKKDNSIEEFWALDDINFEINQGDKVGIIGQNGAGKSTLLKVLSRITEPTTGKIHINSRIASLLEVGIDLYHYFKGFDPFILYKLDFNFRVSCLSSLFILLFILLSYCLSTSLSIIENSGVYPSTCKYRFYIRIPPENLGG